MERLTKKKKVNGQELVYVDRNSCYADSGYCHEPFCALNTFTCVAVERLSAYEDTGLEPEEVEQIKLTLMGKSVAEIKEFEGIPIDRMKELAQAEKDGRLVALPCKIGDQVWWVHNGKITPCRVYRIQLNRRGLLIALRSNVRHGAFSVDRIGKTIFLTRQEAEEALREEADNG